MASSSVITAAADRDLRASDKQVAIIIHRCNPTAAQKPAAAEGHTVRVRRHAHGASELIIEIAEHRQSWGCGRMYPDYAAPSPTATRKANPLEWCSFGGCCCAGSSSVRFSSSNFACLPVCVSMCPTTTTHRLCCSGSAAGVVFGTLPGMSLPIP